MFNTNPMDLSQALATLAKVKQVFDALGVKFTLAAGTLLGAAREGKFMGWDYDTDLSCQDADAAKIPALARALNDLGVTVYYSEAFRVIAVYDEGVTIDIDFWRREGDDLTMPLRYAFNIFGRLLYYFEWILLHTPTGGVEMNRKNKVQFGWVRYYLCNATDWIPFGARVQMALGIRYLARATGNPRGLVRVPASCFASYQPIMFNGEQFLAPGDIDSYLTNRYGPDWRIPQKGWVYYDKKGTVFSASQHLIGDWKFIPFPAEQR